MRTQLHPDLGESVIAARVARQLVALELAKRPHNTRPPGHLTRYVLATLLPEYPGMLRLALHSLGVYLDLGLTSAQWLARVTDAAAFGSSFRRCFFFDYKEQRRAYPRVTNRGVQTSSIDASARVRKGRVNA